MKDVAKLNARLRDFYVGKWDSVRPLLRYPGSSCPQFIQVTEKYVAAPKRLLMVGQQTKGWGNVEEVLDLSPEAAVEKITEIYTRFDRGADYHGKSGFWIPCRELSERLNGSRGAFVTSNLIKLDVSAERPPSDMEDKVAEVGILPGEISIIEPEVIVFFTGPSYESRLKKTCPGVQIQGDKWFATLEHQELPENSFRTYHPAYLNRQSRREEVFDQIERAVVHAA